MMKMTAKMFGVLCAASLVFCAACNNMVIVPDGSKGNASKPAVGDEDGKDPSGDEVTYDVGTTVTISGVKYLVIRNTAKNDADSPDNPSYGYHRNTEADEYRDHLIEMYDVKEPYVLVFNTEKTKSTTTNVTYWDDEYRILRNGVTYYRIRYRWEDLIPNIATITANELRLKYDPTCFAVENYSADYGSDLSKKIIRTYRFKYNDNGTTVTYRDDNWRMTEDYKDFVYINGKERNQYVFTDRISDNARSHILRNPNNPNYSQFFDFRVIFEEGTVTPKAYQLTAKCKGTLDDTATDKDYHSSLYIGSLRYLSGGVRDIWFSVDTKKNDVSDPKLVFEDLYEQEESDEPGDDSGSGVGGNDNTGDNTGVGNDAGEDSTGDDPSNGNDGENIGTGNESSPSDATESDTGGQTEGGSTGGMRAVVVKNERVGKYVSVSKTTKIVNGIQVPETITFSVLFEDENAPMSQFTKVTFVPQEKDNYVVYVPKAGRETAYDFIDNFKAGYSIFGDYAWESPVSTSTPTTDSSVTLQDDATAKADTSTARFHFTGNPFRIEMENMTTSGVDITTDSAASAGRAGLLASEDSRAEAIITFPAGNYTGYAVISAPNGDHDAFYVQFGEGHIRVYAADDPPLPGYKATLRTPIKLSCDREVTVRMVISPRSEKFTDKPVETGMYIDYVEFTKN